MSDLRLRLSRAENRLRQRSVGLAVEHGKIIEVIDPTIEEIVGAIQEAVATLDAAEARVAQLSAERDKALHYAGRKDDQRQALEDMIYELGKKSLFEIVHPAGNAMTPAEVCEAVAARVNELVGLRKTGHALICEGKESLAAAEARIAEHEREIAARKVAIQSWMDAHDKAVERETKLREVLAHYLVLGHGKCTIGKPLAEMARAALEAARG